MSRKLSISQIKEMLEKEDKRIIVLSGEYKNNATKLHFQCSICECNFHRSWNGVKSSIWGCPYCAKNGERLTREEMKDKVKEKGYEILDFLGGDSRKGSLIKISCSYGHAYETNYRGFIGMELKRGGSCSECRKEGNTRRGRIRREGLLEKVISLNYSFSEKVSYITNDREHLNLLCQNGHKRRTNIQNLLKNADCPICKNTIVKHTDESIRKSLEEIGMEYIGGWSVEHRKVEFICSCGKKSISGYYNLLKRKQCSECSNKTPWDLSRVSKLFRDNNCMLLEDVYIDSKERMSFKCSCGKVSKKSLNEFYYRPYCNTCANKNRPRGENHSSWNPNLTDEDREISRKYPEYKKWRLSVFERDNYTCQCCEDSTGGNLQAHHIYNYSEHENLKLDIGNGLTLCEFCHKEFHDIYGYRNNNESQIKEYLNNKRRHIS